MTALLEFQRTLARAVMQPLSSRDNMKRGAEDGIALVKPNSRLSSWGRLEIYNRSYWSRVLDALGEDFPGVRAVVGAQRFERLRRAYLHDCPSESFTMRNLGRHLAAWMERNPALVGPRYELALDMARLEWAEIESFDAAEYEPLSPSEIAALEAASTLQLQPHLQTMKASHEVDYLLREIRDSVKRAGDGAAAADASADMNALPAAGAGATGNATPPAAGTGGRVAQTIAEKRITRARSAAPLYLAIHRFELVVHYKRLDAEMFRLLRALAEGASIGDAVESAYADSAFTVEQCQRHVHDSFALFGALGWFCKSKVERK